MGTGSEQMIAEQTGVSPELGEDGRWQQLLELINRPVKISNESAPNELPSEGYLKYISGPILYDLTLGTGLEPGYYRVDRVDEVMRAIAGTVLMQYPDILKRFKDMQTIRAQANDATFLKAAGAPLPRRSRRGEKENMPWLEEAACRGVDPGVFYPDEEKNEASIMAAKSICGMCLHKDDCLDYARSNKEVYGIWGGLTPPQRKYLREFIKKGKTPEDIEDKIDWLRSAAYPPVRGRRKQS